MHRYRHSGKSAHPAAAQLKASDWRARRFSGTITFDREVIDPQLPPPDIQPATGLRVSFPRALQRLLLAVKRMPIDDSFHFPPALDRVLERCWREAGVPAEWNITQRQFRQLLERRAAQKFSGQSPQIAALEAYLESLNLVDLALAGACSAGNSAAWDHFVAQYRPELYRAARAIAGESQGRELADSLYAELFGLREAEGQRKSLLDYFQGRSKLGTWLRAILAQRRVDDLRRASRSRPLEDLAGNNQGEIAAAKQLGSATQPPDPERERFLAILQAALRSVLAALASQDRLRLAYYYVNDLTLAQIGRLMGEHEATVSRKLERTRRQVRKGVETKLRTEKKLTESQLHLCFEYARSEWPFDLTATLSARD